MASTYPSIQSFYQREIPAGKVEPLKDSSPTIPGDAFTTQELEDALNPLSTQFNPSLEYVECEIGSLLPGPKTVTFVGRIVNFSVYYGHSKSHTAATGWHHMIVKDDTGAICVKLYFINKPYTLKLGLLLTVCTPFIGVATDNNFVISNVTYMTSIFPGRDAGVHLAIHEDKDIEKPCRTPLGYGKSQDLPRLMALKSFMGGGNDIDSKILVCVKSIGPKKAITTKTGVILQLTEVVLFDDTASIVLKLWGDMGLSARGWRPSRTILLFSSPCFRFESRGPGSLGITRSTMIDVEPDFPDADWLRAYANNLNKRERVGEKFPEGIWDVEVTMNAEHRALFTIADIDSFVRSNLQQIFTGFLSLTIMDMSLALCSLRNMLMCTECCGVPIYSNTPTAKCKNCEKQLRLQLNTKIIGTLVDETGSIAPGKLLWSQRAWEDLFGRTVEELAACDNPAIRLIEQRMLFMRVTLVFGWAGEVGKLAILAVRM